jgi:hypothetical protein
VAVSLTYIGPHEEFHPQFSILPYSTFTRLLTFFTKSSFLRIIIIFYKSCELILNFTKHTQFFRSFYHDDTQIGDEIGVRESN